MHLRTQVQLNIGVITAVLALVVGLLVWTLQDFRERQLVQQRVHVVRGHAAATNVLAMEYVLRPTVRIRQQWQNVQDQLIEVVDDVGARLADHEAAREIASLSRQVAAEFATLDDAGDPPDSAARRIRLSRLLADIQAMLSLADQLTSELDARQDHSEFMLTSAILLTVGMLVLATLITYLAIIPSIFRPMASLLEGIRAVGRGEAVDLRECHSSDEFGELARAFVEMQGRLAASRAELEGAIDRTRRINEELIRSNSELNDFAHIASHDLKEPLRAASNHAHALLEDHGEQIGEDGERRLRRLIELSKRMEKLIADLLYLSRLGHGELALEPTDLHGVVDGIESDIAETLRARNARIVVAETLPIVEGHKPHLTALFRNLISNGVKYNDSEEKIIEIGCATQEPADRNGAFDRFYVKDNGIGVEEAFKEDVFRIFKRLNSEKAYGPGTGAGLTFAKKIVERQGGRIWLTSTPGEGTTFWFTLRRWRDGVTSGVRQDAA